MSDLQEPAATPELPDVYTPLQPLLLMLSLSSKALFSRPLDPLPQALAPLTDYDHAAAERIEAVTDSAGLYELWQKDFNLYATHLLVGQLTFASPLGPSLAQLLVPKKPADSAKAVSEHRTELLAYVAHTAANQLEIIEDFLLSRFDEEDRAEATQEWAEFKASIAGAFHDWQHSLGALILVAPAPVLPPDASKTGWSIRPLRLQLDTLKMATTVLNALPALSSHSFAKALQRLPDFHPQRIEELIDYLAKAKASRRLPLSRAQGMLLYIAAHVSILAFLHDLLDGEGLDDMLLRRGPGHDAEITPEAVSKVRAGATSMLGAYVELLRQHERETADFQALEARLAPVLALAVS